MTNILKEISENGLPTSFHVEIAKSAFHLASHKNGKNNSLLNIDSIVELDSIVDLTTHAEKLAAAEKIFSNIDASIPQNNNADNKNNKETVYL